MLTDRIEYTREQRKGKERERVFEFVEGQMVDGSRTVMMLAMVSV